MTTVPSRVPQSRKDLEQHHKPRLSKLLQSVGLDVSFHRGEGDLLYYYDEQGHEVEVLDLVGGHGALLLGHSHPAVVAEAQRLLIDKRPVHVPGSLRAYAQRLARELSDRAQGNYRVIFGNSGSEAVEAALKHAMLETGSRTFLALEGAFHGKTLGAIQLTANERYGESFELSGLKVLRIRLNDFEHLESTFAQADDLAGFLFEPILGEGGIRPMKSEFAIRAAELCAQRRIPLIADECQTGTGRTGDFLASEALGVQPDYIILSKALGGGLAKISALLIQRRRHVEDFDVTHTSTFADDDFSCAIALKTLEVLDDVGLACCRDIGGRMLAGLRKIQEEYPEVIADVRGRGLMIGLEFKRVTHSPSFILRFLSSQDELLLIIAGHMFNVHKIRVAPTLSDAFTLRIQPSVLLSNSQLESVLDALRDVCEMLAADDAVGLTRYLSDCGGSANDEPADVNTDWKFVTYDTERFRRCENSTVSTRVAWLCHFVDADDLTSLEPDFGRLSFEMREQYLEQFASSANPVLMNPVTIQSRIGDSVQLYPIMLPITSRWVKKQIETRKHRYVQTLVQRGVDVARSLNCSLVSLGQYTSIVTRHGVKVDSHGMGITSGNSYAIALAIQAIRRAQVHLGCDPSESVLAVVGATGNIGCTCAEIMAPEYQKTILIGSDSPESRRRLERLSDRIPGSVIAFEPGAVACADVVLAATNSVTMPLGPTHFADRAIVCDVSVPPSVHSDTENLRPDLTIIKGGLVGLPCCEDLEIVGFPLPAGQTYGCMAEGILLGFEGVRDTTFTGPLNQNQVRRIEEIAKRHGFELADFKMSCVLGSESREELDVRADHPPR